MAHGVDDHVHHDPPPPVVPPSGLKATSDCRAIIALPEVLLTWVASPTASVTGYVIFRGLSVSSMSYWGAVSGRTTTAATDLTVRGFGTTYWYEVEAVTGGAFAVSGPASATTPARCISAGPS